MLVQCHRCNQEFSVKPSELAKGRGKFCSWACRNPKIPNHTCAYCGVEFYRSASKKRNSKSGLFFCNRDCKERAQSLGDEKFDVIRPSHYGTGIYYYRNKVERYTGLVMCQHCGWSEYPAVLCVHHRDRDRSNNDLNNLEVLCPNCHMVEHYMAGDGPYTGNPR